MKESAHGLTIFTFVAVTTLMLMPSSYAEQAGPLQPSQPVTGQPPQLTPSGGTPAAPPDKLSDEVQRLTNRVLQLQIDLAKARESSGRDWIPAAGMLGGALIAGLLSLMGQYALARWEERRAALNAQRQLELARQQAILAQTEKFLEFRIKQMELFYAPMFALLEQSSALYNKLLYQLAKEEPGRYKYLSEPDDDGCQCYVRDSEGNWQGFRLLDQLPAIRQNARALALAEGILEIGDRMTKIIAEHAGLASAEIIDLLGRYLAHFAMLSAVHKSGETKAYEPGSHGMGYYPRELNGRIREEYRKISQSLDEYEKAGAGIMQQVHKRDAGH